jgi:predicted enzyme related to lactoylglutathione lyase
LARVTGIGGIFFKIKGNSKELAAWYEKYLGMRLEPFGGAILRWPEDAGQDKGVTVWSVAASDSQWFSPSAAGFMINYRVDDLDGVIARFNEGGIALHQGPEGHENGRFAWVIDPDGNKVELWEPKAFDENNKSG